MTDLNYEMMAYWNLLLDKTWETFEKLRPQD